MGLRSEMLMLSTAIVLAYLCVCTQATDCDADRLKVYVKINYTEWDDVYDLYLLRATTAYSVQKFCGGAADTELDPNDYDCEFGQTADTNTTSATNYTERVSYCMKVENVDVDTVRMSLKESKANLNGALILTDEELVIDGVLPTLETPYEYAFDPWLIAYIVFTACIILAGILVIYYSFRTPKEKDEFDPEEEGLQVEENRGEENRGFKAEGTNPDYEHVTRM